MEIKDIVYNNFLGLLKNLSFDSADFQPYYEAIDEPRQNNLIKLVENISGIELDIQKTRLADQIDIDFDKLIKVLNIYKTDFSDYPDHRITEILVLITLIQKLKEA